jgi:hypothetical protein|eukprot:Transcript_17360.p1 GENE.Transcript_17360~~Transcript_17360.p1  ORF type:complete len:302 (-),score=101.98 Transcript_17360:65-868(-)
MLMLVFPAMVSALTLPGACGSRVASARARPAVAQEYGDKEAANQWYRTGKDTKRWKPGDSTGDKTDDDRLLWSAWKLDPPVLTVLKGSLFADCTLVRLVLNHLGFPHKLNLVDDDGSIEDVPVLEGPGVPPTDVLSGPFEICSFAASVVQDKIGKIAGSTNREDVMAWLDAAGEFVIDTDECVPELALGLACQLRPMLRGVDDEGVATLNQWGFTMDDAMVLASLYSLAGIDGSGEGAPESWPESVREYLDSNLVRAGVLSADVETL